MLLACPTYCCSNYSTDCICSLERECFLSVMCQKLVFVLGTHPKMLGPISKIATWIQSFTKIHWVCDKIQHISILRTATVHYHSSMKDTVHGVILMCLSKYGFMTSQGTERLTEVVFLGYPVTRLTING